MKNIALVGFMGTGKTTIGMRLARKLGYTFVDSDNEVQREEDMSITQIFSDFGEPRFRELEKDMLKRLSQRKGLIISAGGGAVIDPENLDNMKKGGPVVCLTATAEVIYDRIKHSTHRPLLQVDDPMAKIKELLDVRAPFYARADITVDTSGLTHDEVVEKVLEAVKGRL